MKKMPKLKSLFVLHFTFVILLLQFSSCKQENLVQSKENKLTIEQVKSWYIQNIQTKNKGINVSNIQGLKQRTSIAPMYRLVKFIEWTSYHDYKTRKGDFILVDIDDSPITFGNKLTGSRKLVFYLDNSGNIQMNIIECLGISKEAVNVDDYKKIISYYFKIDNSSFSSDDKLFFIYDRQYVRLDSVKISNGKPKTSRSNIKKSQTKISSSNRLADEGDCQQWGVYLVLRDEYGNIIEEELLYTYYVGDCGGSNNEEEMPDEYGGGGDIYIEISETDNLTDPCLVAAKLAITNAGLTNYIYKLYSSAYLSPGNINVAWNQNSYMNLYGQSFLNSSTNTWNIELNNAKFAASNSSKEYVGSVMLHEMVHTLLIQNNITGNDPSNWLDHSVMFYLWTNHFRDALMESFGMDQQSATALALGGIDDVLSFSYAPNSTSWRDFMNNFASSNYGMTLNSAKLTQYMHMTGAQGNPCN